MARAARIVIGDCPHHITQRGNNRQDVFFVDDDRTAYLRFLGEQCRRFGAAVLGYCLMGNHVHLIVVPRSPVALAKAIGRTHWLYAQYVNRLHGRSGHLWQNRFYSNPLDTQHCLLAMRYVERNPIRAGLCRVAARYAWSSAAAHCGGKDANRLLDIKAWKELADGLNWEAQLAVDLPREERRRLCEHVQTGRPLASDGWVSKVERALGRRLRPLPVGRPTKRGKQRREEGQIRDCPRLSHNSKNELTKVGSSTNLAYANYDGNVTTDQAGQTYVYDCWNHPTQVKNSGSTTIAAYAYDALGRRIQETHGTTVTDIYFTHDWQAIEERQSSTVVNQYVWSQAYIDCMVLRDDNSTSGNLGISGSGLGRRIYAQEDANWNVSALLNTSGTVQQRFVYDPYGNPTPLNGAGTSTVSDGYGWGICLKAGGSIPRPDWMYFGIVITLRPWEGG